MQEEIITAFNTDTSIYQRIKPLYKSSGSTIKEWVNNLNSKQVIGLHKLLKMDGRV